MKKEHIIPKWLYYTCVVIMSLGGTGLIMGSLKWGITSEENVVIIMTIFSSGILLFDNIFNLIRKKKK